MEIEELYQKGLELDGEAERLEESGRKDPAVDCQTAYQKAAVLREEAASYWKQAAEQGHADAQYRLALYFFGKKNNQAFIGAKWLLNRDSLWRSTHWGLIIVVLE